MKDNTYYIGIDPGMNGAIAVNAKTFCRVYPISILNGDIIDGDAIDHIINNVYNSDAIVCIEKVWKPSKLVRIAGILEGVMVCHFIPVFRVAPSTWRKEILGNKNATKEDAIKYCLESYPDINLLRTERSRVPDHNLAEAICIAEYAKRKHFVNLVSEDQR